MILPVILVGGTGSRLWPLSRELYPKQFLSLLGSDSLLQTTIKRLKGLEHQPPLLICNKEHRFIVQEQLNLIHERVTDIILEPLGRNTAPAIALAAFRSLQSGEDPLLLILPADHWITEVAAFQEAIQRGIPYALSGQLLTFGVRPTYPETAYGYIKVGSKTGDAYQVDSFVEKPNESLATTYLEQGDYYWNSGLFLCRASVYLRELKHFQPDMYKHCELAIKTMEEKSPFLMVDEAVFSQCPSNSIDFAVMEKTKHAMLIPLNVGWSDIGSWTALWNQMKKDEAGNVHQGDVLALDSRNNFIRSEKLVVSIGLEDTIVIDTQDALLVASKDKVQEVKQAVQMINANKRPEARVHREVFRPWGKFEALAHGSRYQVKRIRVKPGEKLSMQLHYHRAEHWVVVSGTAKVSKGDKTFYLTENQSTYIPLGTVHSLENPGKVPLEIIEVQSGTYLGEDDIVRFEDKYGRNLVDV